MFVKQKQDCEAFLGKSGEVIYELIGKVHDKNVAHSIALVEMKPGAFADQHYHPVIEESYYILKGHPLMVVDGEEKRLAPGQAILISPKSMHQIFNDTNEDVEFLAICAPAWVPDGSVFTCSPDMSS